MTKNSRLQIGVVLSILMMPAFFVASNIGSAAANTPTVSANQALPSGARLVLVSSDKNRRVIYRDGCYVTQEIGFNRSDWQDIRGQAYQCGPVVSPSLP
jgi:hypothetical protein